MRAENQQNKDVFNSSNLEAVKSERKTFIWVSRPVEFLTSMPVERTGKEGGGGGGVRGSQLTAIFCFLPIPSIEFPFLSALPTSARLPTPASHHLTPT